MSEPPTEAERRRFRDMQEIGCIACALEGWWRHEDRWQTPGDIHHIVKGYRIGHNATICLCPWHHRFVSPVGYWRKLSIVTIKEMYGPSLADSPRGFHDRYGSDATLLYIQNEFLKRQVWMPDRICLGEGTETA
jgi:hypothetical protein